MIEDKLHIAQSFIGKKVIYYMPLVTGGVQQQELTVKSARIAKDMVLLDFSEYSSYVVNMDVVGTMTNGKYAPLYEELLIVEPGTL
jgi:hypothetical protein